MEGWIKVCDSGALGDGEMLDFDHGDRKILVVRAGGQVFATDRICTHAYADLSTGMLNGEEKTVTCPLHLSSFKLESGLPQNLPAEEPLKTYKVKIQENAIYIKLE